MNQKLTTLILGLLVAAACSKGDPEIGDPVVSHSPGAKDLVGVYKGIWREQVGRRDGVQGTSRDTSYPGTREVWLVDSGRSFKVGSNGTGTQYQYNIGQTQYGVSPYSLTFFPQADSMVSDFYLPSGYSGVSGPIPWRSTTFCGRR